MLMIVDPIDTLIATIVLTQMDNDNLEAIVVTIKQSGAKIEVETWPCQ